MPYDKTIGGDDFTFSGTLSGTPQTAFDLLSPADQEELLEALFKDGDSTKPKIRVAVDGWIYSSSDFFTCHKADGATETIAANVHYPMPVYQWYRKRLFYGSGGQVVTIRFLLSANYDNRADY
jgi:hypothetical protein